MSELVLTENIQSRAKALFEEAGFKEPINFSTDKTETFFSAMLDVMSTLLAKVKQLTEEKEAKKTEEGNMKEVTSKSLISDTRSAKCQLKAHDDRIDQLHQYSMKGNFIITTTGNKIDGNLEGDYYTQKILDEIEGNYEVKIPIDDVTACHKLSKEGSHIIRLGNRRIGSAYFKLCEAVKSGGVYGREMKEYYEAERAWQAKRPSRGTKPTRPEKPSLFCNFQLTAKRAAITKQLRVLKSEKKISNYYTDANGKISMKVRKDGPKHYLTFDWNKQNSKTINPMDIEELIK